MYKTKESDFACLNEVLKDVDTVFFFEKLFFLGKKQ